MDSNQALVPESLNITEGTGLKLKTCKICTRWSDYSCHEHNQSEINKKHQEEGIGDFSNCMRCHPNGNKEEGDDD